MNEKRPVERCGWVGPSSTYVKFSINTNQYDRILIAHEGRWTEDGDMLCHPHYHRYEDVQADLGCGYVFKDKEFVSILKRSFFLYEREWGCPEYSIVVPATGEEIYFEIYGVKDGSLELLWHGEV